MSCSLNSLKGVIYGNTIGVIEGDTRSLDCSSHGIVHEMMREGRFFGFRGLGDSASVVKMLLCICGRDPGLRACRLHTYSFTWSR